MSINWTKLAESLAPMNPFGPVFMPDGSIYSSDGQMLVPASDVAVAERPTQFAGPARRLSPRRSQSAIAGV